MTSTPNIIPVSPEGDEEKALEPQATRPVAEKPTPSQQGRFLGALEKKDQKKVGEKFASTDEEAAAAATAKENVFRLAKAKGVRSFAESSGGEEGGEGGLHGKKPAPMTPDMTQQAIAAAAAQARVPTPTVSPKGKAAPSPGATGAKGVPQGPSPQKGAALPSKDADAFSKLMGEGGKKGSPSPAELAQATTLPKPVLASSLIADAATTADAQRTSRLALMEVIRQAADALATFITKQETSTVVTIRQPPIFEGATLTVTEYSSAPRQFNITFANLSPEAQRMVESMANQQQLKQALVERGYTVQNVFIEATPGAISPPSAGMPGQGGRAPGEFGQAEQGGGQGGATGGEAGGAE